jgi:pilus assembly protein FimV
LGVPEERPVQPERESRIVQEVELAEPEEREDQIEVPEVAENEVAEEPAREENNEPEDQPVEIKKPTIVGENEPAEEEHEREENNEPADHPIENPTVVDPEEHEIKEAGEGELPEAMFKPTSKIIHEVELVEPRERDAQPDRQSRIVNEVKLAEPEEQEKPTPPDRVSNIINEVKLAEPEERLPAEERESRIVQEVELAEPEERETQSEEQQQQGENNSVQQPIIKTEVQDGPIKKGLTEVVIPEAEVEKLQGDADEACEQNAACRLAKQKARQGQKDPSFDEVIEAINRKCELERNVVKCQAEERSKYFVEKRCNGDAECIARETEAAAAAEAKKSAEEVKSPTIHPAHELQ